MIDYDDNIFLQFYIGCALIFLTGAVVGAFAAYLLPRPRGKAVASANPQSGNVFFALFGAVALIGVIGASTMTILRGPVRTTQLVTQKSIAENQMIMAGRLALMVAIQQEGGGDCDTDGTIEPVPYSTAGTGPSPAGGGYLPNNVGATKNDPWGNPYGYCVWDHGQAIQASECGGGRLRGVDNEAGIVIAVISSGPDRVFQTSCGDHPDYVIRAQSDDIVLEYTYGEAQGLAGGLWTIKGGDPDTAEIGARNIEVAGSGGGEAARIGYDTDLGMAGVGDFLAIKTDNIYSRTPAGTVLMQSPLRVQTVPDLEEPDGGEGDGGAGSLWVQSGNDIYYDAGNVGIGMSGPQTKLDVQGIVRAVGAMTIRGSVGNEGGQLVLGYGGNTTVASEAPSTWNVDVFASTFRIFRRSSDNQLHIPLTILENGNVGVGTQAPAAKLDVAGSVTATGFAGSGANLTNLNAAQLATGTVPAARLGSGTANDTTFLRGDGIWAEPPSGGGTSDSQVFTANGTWTKPSDLPPTAIVRVELWGGGGGGGPHSSAGGGGGGGACVVREFLASDLSSTVSITIGAGGDVGQSGGNSTFGTYLTAYGGGATTASNTNRAGGGGGWFEKGANGSGEAGGNGGRGASGVFDPWTSGGGGGGTAGQGSGGFGPIHYGGGYLDGSAGFYGGGGGSSGDSSAANARGGTSVWGGGGGSGRGSTGGFSVFGGNGGARKADGEAPGGGGGGQTGKGARGECRVYIRR